MIAKPTNFKGYTYTGTTTPSAGSVPETWFNPTDKSVNVWDGISWKVLYSEDYPSGSGTSGFVDENDEPL